MNPSSGIHLNVPFDTYRSWDAINVHGLMPMEDSPAHALHNRLAPRSGSPEQDVGSATHVAVFEPHRFESDFYLGQTEYDSRTTEGKAIAEQEKHAAGNRTYIRKKKGEAVDCDSVTGMQSALWKKPATRKWLELPGQCEASLVWQDPITKLMCKGRFDKLIPAATSPIKRAVVVDLKTTGKGKGRTDRFSREIAKFDYAAQAAFYLWGHKILTGEDAVHLFLVAESVAPYATNWGTLDDGSLQTGARQFRNWLDAFAECIKSDKWPDYPESQDGKAPVFSLPRWVQED